MTSPPTTVTEARLVNKLGKIPRSVSATVIEKAIMLYVILTDRNTPAWARVLVLAALVYLINPWDAIPDNIPVVGYTDDVAVMAITLERLSSLITPDIKRRAKELLPWDRKRKTLTPDSSGKRNERSGKHAQKLKKERD